MEEDFVLHTEALALKEMGFNDKCHFVFSELGHCSPYVSFGVHNSNVPSYSTRPTYSQVFRWFRKKHQLYHEIQIDQTTEPKYCFEINKFIGNPNDLAEREWGWEKIPNDDSWGLYGKYEEAELACLKKLIELVKVKR